MKHLLFCLLLLASGGTFAQDGLSQENIDNLQAEKVLHHAEEHLRKDNYKLALGDGKSDGLLKLVNLYNHTPAGNLAAYYAGICYLHLGQLENAVTYLNRFKPTSDILQGNTYKLLGDAHGDLRQFAIALDYYKKSYASFSGHSAEHAREALYYAGFLADKVMNEQQEALAIFTELKEKFPGTTQAAEAEKYIRQYQSPILAGAERINVYLPLIKGRKVGIFANHTSMVGNTHLVDTLRKLGVDVKVIFGPEHGFRGTADAGEKVGNYIDEATGIPVISLYGSKRKPSPEDVKDVEILIFDIQDVGVRFYTYISSLEEFMEAAFEMGKPLMILDRPNPNGFYVDGPVLDTRYRSFVGRQTVPIVYGMTVAEYALMIAGEKWLSPAANARYEYYVNHGQNSVDTPFHFQIIKCGNYTHNSKYVLPVKPSPNLPNIQSIYLYPFTCLFEGTVLSEGRGTNKQFQVFGHPSLPKNLYAFTPNPNEGAKKSKHYGLTCYGWDLSGTPDEVLAKVDKKVQLKWLIQAYRLFPQKDSFFIVPKSGKMEESFFTKLAGNNELWQQIKSGKSEEAIRKTWEPKLAEFKKIRKKYLLYDDFE